jgi:DNA-directed RNA polymerase specialized sigma24 family protein
LDKLPDNQRELVECRYFEEGSIEEHARKTGRKPSALRVALLRIRETLRVCVETNLKERTT